MNNWKNGSADTLPKLGYTPLSVRFYNEIRNKPTSYLTEGAVRLLLISRIL